MSAYSGTPTVIAAWEVGDRQGKFIRSARRLSLSLTAQGGATNNIPASALSFSTIIKAVCLLFTDGSSNKRVVHLFTDGTYLFIADPTQATDANRGLAGDVTGTLVCEVEGIPL